MGFVPGNPGHKGNSRAGSHAKFRAVFDKFLDEEKYWKACEALYEEAVVNRVPALLVKLHDLAQGKGEQEQDKLNAEQLAARWEAFLQSKVQEKLQNQAPVSNMAGDSPVGDPKSPTIQ